MEIEQGFQIITCTKSNMFIVFEVLREKGKLFLFSFMTNIDGWPKLES